jgi:hypothetical protein
VTSSMSDSDAFDELPELMLSLRSFGSRRASPNEGAAFADEQDRFFSPLLEGRRMAAQAISRSQVIAAFDSQRLTGIIDATVRGIAAERYGSRAPARRAFEAALFEIIEPLREALDVLQGLAYVISRNQGAAIADDQWTPWLAQLRVVFHVADASWPALRDALTAAPRPSVSAGRWRFTSRGDGR